ncbi:MAG: hypothetical protein JSR46_11870 [Verrucomicrobia bacterium]|nr:hypothetical protein [Verrucomicrobiota bacterium]
MNPTTGKTAHDKTVIPTEVKKPEQKKEETIATAHVQTDADKEHAKAQLEMFTSKTSPRLETVKVEAIQEPTVEQLNQITNIQEELVKGIMNNQQILIGVQQALTKPESVPALKASLKEFEDKLPAETKALNTFLVSTTKARIVEAWRQMPFMGLDNALEAVEVAVRRVLALTSGAEGCEKQIREISPEYLRRLALVDEKGGMSTVDRVCELTAQLEQLPKDALGSFQVILLLEGEDQEKEVESSFGKVVPPAIKEALAYLKEIEKPETRTAVIDGFNKMLQEKLG